MGILTMFSGELKGSTDAKQLPDKAYNYAYLKAATDNTGVIYVGPAGVTRPVGSSDSTTTGFPLSAGQVLPLDGEGNLKSIYFIGTAATDDLIYWGVTLY